MIPFMKKYYKLAPNGKMELLGRDGNEHGMIQLLANLLTTAICLGFWFFYPIKIPLALIVYILCIVNMCMMFMWVLIEMMQERAMVKRDRNRYLHWYNVTKFEKARWVDINTPTFVGLVYVLIVGFTVSKLGFDRVWGG